MSYAERAWRARRELNRLPKNSPYRDEALRTWRWFEARKHLEPKTPQRKDVGTPGDGGGPTLRSRMAAHGRLIRSMQDMQAGGREWNAAQVEARRLEGLILDHHCVSTGQVLRMKVYCQSAGIRVADGFWARKVAEAREAMKGTVRTVDNPQTTYEVGIIGSDRVPLAPAQEAWSRYHRKYPLDIMEVGEECIAPGIERRAQIGAALSGAQRGGRKFTTEATEAGLLIRRTA